MTQDADLVRQQRALIALLRSERQRWYDLRRYAQETGDRALSDRMDEASRAYAERNRQVDTVVMSEAKVPISEHLQLHHDGVQAPEGTDPWALHDELHGEAWRGHSHPGWANRADAIDVTEDPQHNDG